MLLKRHAVVSGPFCMASANPDGCRRHGVLRPIDEERPESRRYWFQVDRQAKGFYPTAEAAQSAALVIKKCYPVVPVSVHNRVGSTNTQVELRGGLILTVATGKQRKPDTMSG